MTQSLNLIHFPAPTLTPQTVTPDHFQSGRTKLLFIGGLTHLSGTGLTKGLAEILSSLIASSAHPDAALYTLAFDATEGEIAKTMLALAEEQNRTDQQPLAPEAGRIVDEILLPSTVTSSWKTMPAEEQRQAMRDYFDQIKLIGYSYGTSLVQQIDLLLQNRLHKNGLPPDALNKVSAINIGPIVPPLENGCFQQLFAFAVTDKSLAPALRKRLLHRGSTDYDIFEVGKTICIGECHGDQMLRYIAIQKFPSGSLNPKIIFNFDYTAHTLRFYTNIPEVRPNGDAATYPSSAFGWILREAALSMMAQDASRSFKNGSILSRFLNSSEEKQAKEETKRWLEKWQQKFACLLNDYSQTTQHEAISLLQNTMDCLKQTDGAMPFPPKQSARMDPTKGLPISSPNV